MKKEMLTLSTYLAKESIEQTAFDAMNAEEKAGIFNAIQKNNIEYVEELKENSVSKEDLAKALQSFNDEKAKSTDIIMEAIAKQGNAISKMAKGSNPAKPATIKSQIADSLEEVKALRPNTDQEVTIKADVSTASITDNTGSFRDQTISPLNVQNVTMENLFPSVTIGGNNLNKTYTYMDWDEATVDRAAAMIAECGAFPESEVGWIEKSIKIKKVGDTLPVCEEFFEDESMFASELDLFLRTNVILKVNDQILNGDGTGENLTGLVTSATPFVASASGITDASIFDLIVKVKSSITALGQKFMPNFVVMNNEDICKMNLKKDANNNYVMPPFVSRDGEVVKGMVIIEDNALTANTMVVGDSRYGRVINRIGMQMSKGYINDQFTKDQTTLKVRRRLAFLIKDADKTGFSYVSDIAADLVTLAS